MTELYLGREDPMCFIRQNYKASDLYFEWTEYLQDAAAEIEDLCTIFQLEIVLPILSEADNRLRLL